MNSSTLVTSNEACERLGISRPTLSRWVTSGRLKPAQKLPGVRGAYLFDPEVIDQAVAALAAADGAAAS